MSDIRYQILTTGGVYDHQEKVIVLPDKSSDRWQGYLAWLTQGNTPLPPDAVAMDDLATAQEKRCAEIDAFASGLRNTVIAGRSSGEMSSWSIKLAEARAFAQGGDAAAPTLAATATIMGITTASLVAKVLGQAAPFLQAEATIDGIRGKHCDAVTALTDVRDITLYDWHSGWPNLSGS